jgi:membrane associated rhomboid family serine protease
MLRRFIYFPTVVQILLILNGIAFLLLMIAPVQMFENFALWPLGLTGQELYGGLAPRFQIWQLISYSFLHGGVFHLLINMYVLWLFGHGLNLPGVPKHL